MVIYYFHECFKVKNPNETPHKMTTFLELLEKHPLRQSIQGLRKLDVTSNEFRFLVLMIKAVVHKEE